MMLALALLAMAQGDAGLAEPGKERLVCRRETPIGSLIPRRKMCLTKTQWEQRERDGNDEARKMAYDNMGRCFDPGLCPR